MSLYTPADVPLQKQLLDPDNTTTTVHDDFLREFAEVVGGRWPSLASILSFSTADVEEMKTEVVGTPAEQALHMLRVWKRGSREATYGGLCTWLKRISLFELDTMFVYAPTRPSQYHHSSIPAPVVSRGHKTSVHVCCFITMCCIPIILAYLLYHYLNHRL